MLLIEPRLRKLLLLATILPNIDNRLLVPIAASARRLRYPERSAWFVPTPRFIICLLVVVNDVRIYFERIAARFGRRFAMAHPCHHRSFIIDAVIAIASGAAAAGGASQQVVGLAAAIGGLWIGVGFRTDGVIRTPPAANQSAE